jgi:hypothetical protein
MGIVFLLGVLTLRPATLALLAVCTVYLTLALFLYLALVGLALSFACLLGWVGLSTAHPVAYYFLTVLYLVITVFVIVVVLVFNLSSLVVNPIVNPITLLLAFLLVFGPLFLIRGALVFLGYVFAASSASGSATPTTGDFFARGFLIGLNACTNVAFGVVAYFFILGPVLGLLMLAVFLITAVGLLVDSSSPAVKGLVGYLAPLMPTSWVTTGTGWFIFTLNLLGHLFSPLSNFFKVFLITPSWSTFSFVCLGGLCSNLNLQNTAYNLGSFIFMHYAAAHMNEYSQHEIGHHLSLGAFGGHFHFIGWLDEFRSGQGSGAAAYAERLAQGNAPANAFAAVGATEPPRLIMWQTS